MSIALYAQTPYPQYEAYGRSGFAAAGGGKMPVPTDFGQMAENEKTDRMRQVRKMLRRLNDVSQAADHPYETDPLHTDPSEEGQDEETKKPVNYNYKEVATKIQRAKTSVSAEQAVLSAKRKVLQLKRKMAAGHADPEQLQAALTHARRMEMTARKKKHHLELEEMVQITQKADKEQSGMEDALKTAGEERICEKEDAIFEERQDMIREAAGEDAGLSEEMLTELNEMIAEFGEEELKELEEAMEIFENMEIINPHMDKEALDAMKLKHRASENKAIVKADMDYLKDVIKPLTTHAVGMAFDVQI